jgi:DNA-binding response OmpR family regulator
VRDSGPGIPADQIVHVFERFYQVDESATRTQPGTGIGLSLVKELVELHGGTIVVESGDTGTTFTASIPVTTQDAGLETSGLETSGLGTRDSTAQASLSEEASSALRASRPSPRSPVPGPRSSESSDDETNGDVPTLLVVDDSADLRGYIRDHFAPRFRVVEASDGAEGIDLARRHLPDIVLSDVMMPGTDGHELVRVLRSNADTDFLSIVLLTAQAEDERRLEGLERGADDYIVKPFEMRELDVRVRNLIASRRRLRERFSTTGTSGLGSEDSAGTPSAADARAGSATIAPVDAQYMERVRGAIRRSLSDPDFGVGELADAVSQDRSHLFRRVKQVFGESPSDLIRRMRVEEGARLLMEGSETVTDVAYAVGFNSLSYFCHCFQQSYGVTPAAYRSRASAG